MKRTILLLKNINTNNLEIHYQKDILTDDVKQMYLEEGYFDNKYEYIYHWNNISTEVRLDLLLERNHFIGIYPGRTAWTPMNMTYNDCCENGYFDLNNGASELSFILKTDNKNYTKEYYINYITKKINNTPIIYD